MICSYFPDGEMENCTADTMFASPSTHYECRNLYLELVGANSRIVTQPFTPYMYSRQETLTFRWNTELEIGGANSRICSGVSCSAIHTTNTFLLGNTHFSGQIWRLFSFLACFLGTWYRVPTPAKELSAAYTTPMLAIKLNVLATAWQMKWIHVDCSQWNSSCLASTNLV